MAVNFKCPMKAAFFHVKGVPVCNIWLLLQSSLLRYRRFGSLWHSSKQLQRLLLNQGGLHDHLYIALNPDIAVLRTYNLSCELAGKYHQPPLLWSCCIHSR